MNDGVYKTFKELFEGINLDSMKEVLLKVGIYNNIISRFVDGINSKYGMNLTFTTIDPGEVGPWAENFQIASGNNKAPESPWPQQAQEELHRSGGLQFTQQNSQAVTEWPHQQTSQSLPTLTGQQPYATTC